jgi:hypothetical protein
LGSVSLHSTEMQKRFRKRDNGGYYLEVINHYFDCTDGKYRFSPFESYTKKYRVKDWVIDRLLEDYRAMYIEILGQSAVSELLHCNAKQMAVQPIDKNGNPVLTHAQLNQLLPVNFDRLMWQISEIESKPHKILTSHTELYNLLHLYSWMEAYHNHGFIEGIEQRYVESGNGRLNEFYNESIPHIITTPKRIRKVLMGGMGLVDYDISNCHIAIFSHSSKQLGLQCPYIDHYAQNCSSLRYKWSEEFNVKMSSLKPYLLSWLYGNTNREITKNAFSNKIHLDTLSLIREDDTLRGMYEEIVSNRPLIIQSAIQNDGRLVNRMGKSMVLSKKEGKNLSFLFFGWEAKIMETINLHIGDKMKALIYDGWIGTEVDMAEIEQVVYDELGISIQLHDEPFE